PAPGVGLDVGLGLAQQRIAHVSERDERGAVRVDVSLAHLAGAELVLVNEFPLWYLLRDGAPPRGGRLDAALATVDAKAVKECGVGVVDRREREQLFRTRRKTARRQLDELREERTTQNEQA